MKGLRNQVVLWGAGVLFMLALTGCAVLRGEDGAGSGRDCDSGRDGYDHYDEMDDHYYEYMGY